MMGATHALPACLSTCVLPACLPACCLPACVLSLCVAQRKRVLCIVLHGRGWLGWPWALAFPSRGGADAHLQDPLGWSIQRLVCAVVWAGGPPQLTAHARPAWPPHPTAPRVGCPTPTRRPCWAAAGCGPAGLPGGPRPVQHQPVDVHPGQQVRGPTPVHASTPRRPAPPPAAEEPGPFSPPPNGPLAASTQHAAHARGCRPNPAPPHTPPSGPTSTTTRTPTCCAWLPGPRPSACSARSSRPTCTHGEASRGVRRQAW